MWIDEAWTGKITGHATLGATIRQNLLDANAPAYFVLMHFWTKLFGLSDATLRFPSFVFGAMAPLVALIPTRGMERNVRLLWCRLVALWITGIWYSQEARSYSLALFLSMACTLAYVRLLTQPSMRDRSCMGVAWISGNPHALPFVVVSRLPRHWLFGGPSTCSGRRSFSSRFIAEKLPIW